MTSIDEPSAKKKSPLERAVSDVLEKVDARGDVAEQIVNGLYSVHGQKYFFLFNQNVRRTNIQFAELISLIRTHLSVSDGARKEVDFADFKYVKNLVDASIRGIADPLGDGIAQLTDEIAQICDNRILLEALYGSASVFFPPHLSANIQLICGESGYIHSCGHLLRLRNATKVTSIDVEEALKAAGRLGHREQEGTNRVFVVPYSHEDFTPRDRKKSQFYQFGLDDVKIHISKAHVGTDKLIEVLEKFVSRAGENYFLSPAGDYHEALSEAELHFENNEFMTVWVLADAELVLGSRFPGDKKFYCIYMQLYSNKNFYHLFDENKPGWASHTTLPHSLTGAMMNIVRPWLVNMTEVRVADPFGGSGTTFFEGQKIPNFDVSCTDLSSIYKYVVDDNVRFFNSDSAAIDGILRFLRKLKKASPTYIGKRGVENRNDINFRLNAALLLVQEWAEKCDCDFLKLDPNDVKNGMERLGVDLRDRLVLYLLLKTFGRSQSEIIRGADGFSPAFQREIDAMIEACTQYVGHLGSERKSETARICVVRGSYSDAVMPRAPTELTNDLFGSANFGTGDVKALPRNTFDVIVTDPPYAFNTDENVAEFSGFVREMLAAIIASLKDSGGQLVMACPAASFSGRPVVPFIRSDYVTRQIIRLSAEQGKRCNMPAFALPSVMSSMRPPYYWVAEKTLRRRILHFWIEAVAK